MTLKRVQATFETLGKSEPFWTVLTHPEYKRDRCDTDKFFATGRAEIARVLKYVDSKSLYLRKGKTLDFGCGVGRLSQALCEHFDQVVGVDISQPMLDTASVHNRFGTKCQYVLNRSNNLAIFDNASFDFIYSNITLQHMEPLLAKGYIAEFFRILRLDGIVIFQLPSKKNATYPTNSLKGRYQSFKDAYMRPAWRAIRKKLVLEMHAIPRADVERLIVDQKGKLVDTAADFSAGREWESFRYCATRNPSCS